MARCKQIRKSRRNGYLDTCDLSKLSHSDIGAPNRTIIKMKIESAIKILPKKKILGPMNALQNSKNSSRRTHSSSSQKRWNPSKLLL